MGIVYSLIICILILVAVAITSLLIRYYILGMGCYAQPSPYCPADPVCPQTNGMPIWMACEAQDTVSKCQQCPDGQSCYDQGQSCSDQWCVNCGLQSNCSESCTRFNSAVPICPSSTTPCISNVPT